MFNFHTHWDVVRSDNHGKKIAVHERRTETQYKECYRRIKSVIEFEKALMT